MKKSLITLVSIILVLSLVLCGCSSEKAPSEEAESGLSITETDSGEELPADTAAFDYGALLDDNGFFADYTAADYVTIPEYKGIEIPASVLTASDEDIQEQIDYVLSQNPAGYINIFEGTIADGDTVNIDYVGKIDGVAFDGGSTQGQGTDVTIGVTQYIPGFLDQLIGHKVGETFDINVTFPENYGKEELNGKDAVFTITVNYIQGDAIPATFNDDFAANYGFTTADEMRQSIADWLVNKQKESFVSELFSEATVTNVPEEITAFVENSIISEFEAYAASNNYSVEDMLAYNGFDSIDALIEFSADTISSTAHDYLVIEAIAADAGITVSEDYVLSVVDQDRVDTYGLKYMKQYCLRYAVTDYIFDNAK